MLNAFKQFDDLIPAERLEIVTITAHNGDGSQTVQTLGGQFFRATGVKVEVGKKAYCDVNKRAITSEAPNLPVVAVTLY